MSTDRLAQSGPASLCVERPRLAATAAIDDCGDRQRQQSAMAAIGDDDGSDDDGGDADGGDADGGDADGCDST